jgi:hypothetical protein
VPVKYIITDLKIGTYYKNNLSLKKNSELTSLVFLISKVTDRTNFEALHPTNQVIFKTKKR